MKVLEQFRLGQEIIKAQFRIRSKDGGICWVDCRGRVVEDERGSKWVHAVMIDDTEAQNQKQEYWEKSMRDSLTGLFNRDAAVQSVNRYMQDGSRAPEGTLMVIDLDNFKEINDTKGHLFGDSVLTEAARCIAGVFDSQDMVGRIGGDEFLVFSKQLSGREEIMKRGRQLIEDIAGLPSRKKERKQAELQHRGRCVSGGRQHIRAAVPESGYGSLCRKKLGQGPLCGLRFIPKACGQRKTHTGKIYGRHYD